MTTTATTPHAAVHKTLESQPGATSVAPDTTWVDRQGNATNTPGSQNFDPPNFVPNFSDVGQIISGFGGFPYKGYAPADCPDVGDWP